MFSSLEHLLKWLSVHCISATVHLHKCKPLALIQVPSLTVVRHFLFWHCIFLLQNYQYAGVQFSFECRCGNNYGLLGKASESDCNEPCSGNPHQICGDANRNSIYYAGMRSLWASSWFAQGNEQHFTWESIKLYRVTSLLDCGWIHILIIRSNHCV